MKKEIGKFNWQVPLLVFVAWRIGLGALIFLSTTVIKPVGRAGTSAYIVGSSGFWSDHLLAAWSRWDGEWYLRIATNGYQANDSTAAFFPLFPLLLKVLGTLLFGNYLLAGVLIAGLATLAAFILLYALTQRDFNSKSVATSTLIYLAIFPTTFFLSAIYTESLFLAFTLGAFLCVRHLQKWWLAGLLMVLATWSRNLGVLLILPLGWEWWTQFRDKQPFSRAQLFKLLPIVLLPGLALLGWLGFNWLTLGDPFTFLKALSTAPWLRHNAWFWDTLWQAAQTFTRPPPGSVENYNLLNFVFLVVFLSLFAVTAWLVYRKQYPASYLIFFALGLLLPLSAPGQGEPLVSFPRYVLVLFPAFQVLALLIRRIRLLDMLYVLIGTIALAFFLSRFVQWYWVA